MKNHAEFYTLKSKKSAQTRGSTSVDWLISSKLPPFGFELYALISLVNSV